MSVGGLEGLDETFGCDLGREYWMIAIYKLVTVYVVLICVHP